MAKRDVYRLEEEKNLEEIADYLNKISDEIRKGKISFSNGESFELPNTVVLDIDVDQRKKADLVASSVEIEIKWTENK